MTRFITLLLIFWLPLQGYAAVSTHHAHTSRDQIHSASEHHSAAANMDCGNTTNDDTDEDSHCAACHLSLNKFLVSTTTAAAPSTSHYFYPLAIHQLISIDSAVPEPIPLPHPTALS